MIACVISGALYKVRKHLFTYIILSSVNERKLRDAGGEKRASISTSAATCSVSLRTNTEVDEAYEQCSLTVFVFEEGRAAIL